jgi:ArsR family transcriptional regulator
MEKIDAITALSALAQENRLDVFRLLVSIGAEGLPAGEIAERLKLPSPTLSFHLAQLKQARLVRARRDGRSLIYAADYEGMNTLMGFLTENCCAGDPAACGLPVVCAPAPSVSLQRKGARS